MVGKYWQGRWGKQGRERYAFVIHRFPFALDALWGKYRRRFGIESAHRVWEQARARTASRRAGLRLLLMGIAVLLHNLWVYLKWAVVSRPRLVEAKGVARSGRRGCALCGSAAVVPESGD